MKTSLKVRVSAISDAAVVILSGCGAGGGGTDGSSSPSHPVQSTQESSGSVAHGHAMDGGPAQEAVKQAVDPRYPVGAEVILKADHMPGMMNAPATISGAFQTTAYAVDYTPTDGGQAIKDHKWVVQEELQGAREQRLAVGRTAVMMADHMPGMKGATATI